MKSAAIKKAVGHVREALDRGMTSGFLVIDRAGDGGSWYPKGSIPALAPDEFTVELRDARNDTQDELWDRISYLGASYKVVHYSEGTAVVHAGGRVWWPGKAASDEIRWSDDPDGTAISLAKNEPELGEWQT